MQTERSKQNKQTSETFENKATEKNNNKFQQFKKFSQSLSNIENNSDFESSVDCINTKDSVANYTAIRKHIHVDIPSETRLNSEHIE